MQKNVFVESVLLEINGGTLNDSSAVKREDILAYLPVACNYAMEAGYNKGIQYGDGRDFSGMFTGSFYDLPIIRDLGKYPYVTLPKGTVALPRNQGIRAIFDGCDEAFTPLSDADKRTVKYYKKLLPGEKFFRLTPKTLEFVGIPPLMGVLPRLDMIVRTEDLDDTDELPLPAGTEILAMEQCIKKFGNQRQNISDKKDDAIDINSIKQP